jgi:hypothetical protein
MSDARDTGRRGLLYGLATIDLEGILRAFALDPSSPEFKAPLGAFGHARRLADTSDASIVALNADTPYSYAWLDLRAEPVVLTMPAHEPDRYVSAQVNDLYAFITGYVSPRTHGCGGARVLIAGPDWDGEAPDGMDVLRSTTRLSLVLVRTQLFDDADLPNVTRLQDAMTLTPLSALTGAPPPAPPPPLVPVDPVDVRAAPRIEAFGVLAWMQRLMPVLPEHEAVRADLRGLGVGDAPPARIPAAAREEILAGMGDAVAEIGAYARTLRSSGDIFGSREFFAGDDLRRAAGAYLGILGNASEEYLGVGYQADAEGRPFSGERRYAITFSPGGLPPVGAFWSITLYDAGHLYPNDLGRHVLGSRQLAAMARDPDGGVTIDVRHDAPAPERTANWLPCPAGPFGLTFRTYLPGEAIRDGSWTAPPVVPHER